MTTDACLSEQDLLDLFYGESETPADVRRHLDACDSCRASLAALERQLAALSDPLPHGGERALAGALKTLGLQSSSGRDVPSAATSIPMISTLSNDILTLSEVAAYLRVDLAQVQSLLPDLPHLNVGGAIRVRRSSLEAFLKRMESESTRRPMTEAVAPSRRRLDLI